MNKKTIKDLVASVRDRLVNYSHEKNEEPNTVLTRFAIERLLYRLTKSKHKDRFILKGALLFLAWEGQPHRPTRDLDLLGKGVFNENTLSEHFVEICSVEVEEDGLKFDGDHIKVAPIREENKYGGLRVTMTAFLGKARIPVQVDVGIGDAVVPGPELLTYPTILDFPAPKIRAYRREVVIAEKSHAIVVLGMQNSRMKDIFDLWLLVTQHSLDIKTLSRAIRATFKRRKTPMPNTIPLALTETFAKDPVKQTQWIAFLKKNRLGTSEVQLLEIIKCLQKFLWPLLKDKV